MFRQSLVLLAIFAIAANAKAGLLGSAETYAVLGGTTVTNTGPSILTGNLGVAPGTSITGFPPGTVVNGGIHLNDGHANQAQADMLFAYNSLVAEAPTQNLTGQDLGGLVLLPGVYHFDSSAGLTGLLTLNAQGNPNARFVFQIGSTLTTASSSLVSLINAAEGCNVYWQIGSSATLGTFTEFQGHILAAASITMTTGATIGEGSALARAAVTLDSNRVTACVPEPATIIAMSAGVLALLSRRRNGKR